MFELLSQENLLNPATLDTLWTMSVTALLLGATTLTAWLLPWSNQEVMAVHSAARTATMTLIQTATPAQDATPSAAVRELIPARRIAANR